MTRLACWNVRHLSEGTNENRKEAIEETIKSLRADLFFFSELTTTCTWPKPQNLTYRKPNDKQLCYGCIDSNGKDVELTQCLPTTTAAYQQAGNKHGNDFTLLADRALASYGTYKADGKNVQIYLLHAPAEPSGVAVSFVGCYLDQHHGTNPWLLIGDLNVEPQTLAKVRTGIMLQDLVRAPSEPTRIGKNADKTYDYVLSNFEVKIQRIRTSARLHGSDHYPIIVDY